MILLYFVQLYDMKQMCYHSLKLNSHQKHNLMLFTSYSCLGQDRNEKKWNSYVPLVQFTNKAHASPFSLRRILNTEAKSYYQNHKTYA